MDKLRRTTAITIVPPVFKSGALYSGEVLQVYQPKPRCQGGQIKWYQDKIREEKKQ